MRKQMSARITKTKKPHLDVNEYKQMTIYLSYRLKNK